MVVEGAAKGRPKVHSLVVLTSLNLTNLKLGTLRVILAFPITGEMQLELTDDSSQDE